MRRLRIIIWKELRHLHNDPASLRLMIMPVIAQVLILGYAITTEVRNTPITACDKSATPQSRQLVQTLAQNKLFVFRGMAPSEEAVRDMLDHGRARIGVMIPADFSRRIEEGRAANVTLIIDGQDANSAGVAGGYVRAIINGWAMRMFTKKLEARGITVAQILPVTVRPQVLFNPLLKSTWHMVPAMAVLLVTMITALLTGFSIVREKESGTLEQLMVTPIRPIELVIGKSVPFMLIGLVELAAVLVIAQLWFGIPFRGNYLTILCFALVYMFSSIGIGILTSTLARTPHQSLFMTWFILLFFVLLSGFFLPLENMPHWVQQMTVINPVRYFMFVVREVFLKGSGFAELGGELRAMALIGVAVYCLALLNFRRKAR
jgi:ABC-2 type transport system permease protein